MELLILLPVLMLLLAASILVVSQIVSFFQYRRFKSRQKIDRRAIDGVMKGMEQAQFELSRRGAALETATRRLGANNEELARLNLMKSKFLSMAVHDVRTPLATVKGFAQMLGRTPGLGPKERQYVDYIRRASDQINSLMGDLTDLAVIEAGKFRLQPERLDLSSFLAEVIPGIAFIAETKGVHFSTPEVPEGNPAFAGDRQRLARVLGNLLGNAVKFTPAGGSVELRVRMAAGKMQFAVKDTGPGIHPTERVKIFEKFYQSKYLKNEKARAAGWGLGLAIAEEIVRSHGGAIGVDSPGLGKGSTFWVRLPVEGRRPVRMTRALAAFAAFAAFAASAALPARAQVLPLEEKARYEEALERKADGVLLGLLGPNRYKVSVDATIDFTRIERYESKEATAAPAAVPSPDAYLWGSDQAQAAAPELLPGISVPTGGPSRAAAPAAPKGPQSYERRNTYPTEFLKRLSVTVVLDNSVDVARADDIRGILADILGIVPMRGDELMVVRSGFAPVWKTLWYQPETAGLILKYALLAILSLLTLIVVAICLLRLSDAMSEMASAQTQQMTMEMRAAQAEDAPPQLEGGELAGLQGPGGAAEGASSLVAVAPAVRFDVRPEQVEALAGMLESEDPANIALICAHLEPGIRGGLFERLAPEVTAEVFVHMGRIRFVEPDMILNLKEEIERRLAGAVGGLGSLAELVEQADLSERGRMFEVVAKKDPKLAAELRGRVFLLEDLAELSIQEWSHLLPRLTNEEWALALNGAPDPVKEALRGAVGPGQWRVLGQLLETSVREPEERLAAQRRLMAEAEALKREGRLTSGGLALAGSKKKEGKHDVA